MRTRLASAVLVVVTALAALALLTPAAFADGDPASDVLLGENVFYPYQPNTSQAVQKRLNAAAATAAKARFPLKIALIASPVDLGIIPQLLGHPQQYAAYLDVEISFERKQPLLVVMKDGYGVEGLTPAATALAAKLPLPASGTPDDLAQAALTATAKLAAADGHPISGSSVSSSGSSGSSGGGGGNAILLITLVVAAIVTASALILVRRRQPKQREG